MKNLKLTLATTLSALALALTFTGAAFAGDGENVNFFDNDVITKTAKITKTIVRAQPIERPLQYTPIENVITSKVVYNKPVKVHRYGSRKRFNKMSKYEQRANYKRYIKRHNRYQSKRAVTPLVYKVRSGDTLIKIAKKTGVSVYELARVNRIKYKDLNHLRIGQKLRLA